MSLLALFYLLPPVSAKAEFELDCDIQQYSAKIIHTYPHSRSSFTQGLVYQSGLLYESIGLYRKSAILSYSLDKPVKERKRKMLPRYFGEGLTIVNENLVQLTYRSKTGFVYDKKTLKVIDTFNYPGEGWGLTYDGVRLIVSDGTDTIKYLNAENYRVVDKGKVKRCGKPVKYINELEYVENYVYANIWRSNKIIIFSPLNGIVVGEVNLDSIAKRYQDDATVDVLNGIAWDNKQKRLFVTGKHWPHLYQIKLEPKTISQEVVE